MRVPLQLFAAMVLVAGGALAHRSFAQQNAAPANGAAAMRMAQELSPPVAEHEQVKKLAGDWKYTGKFRIPGLPEMVAEGKATGRTVLGDRFVLLESSGDVGQGVLVENLFVFGYDVRHKKYTTFMIDNTGTHSATAEGVANVGQPDRIVMQGGNETPGVGTMKYELIVNLADPKRIELTTMMPMGPKGELVPIVEAVLTK